MPNKISIHALLAESDTTPTYTVSIALHFYPRSPCGERPYITTTTICTVSFLSTLSLRRATCDSSQKRHPPHNFYPRSPCGERRDFLYSTMSSAISIHALLAESDAHCVYRAPGGILFLSTLSLRRATLILAR